MKPVDLMRLVFGDDYYMVRFQEVGVVESEVLKRILSNKRVGPPCYSKSWELTGAWTGAKVTVPVKYVTGDHDLVYTTPGMKEYVHDSSGFKRDVPLLEEIVVMEGVGHFINQERPNEINEHIYHFFKKFL
ncbi:hypothetical protein LINPERPRIM_LOCUS43561 [Linum perenne]